MVARPRITANQKRNLKRITRERSAKLVRSQLRQRRSPGAIVLALLPVIVMVGVFRGTPPPTIGEVLYEAEHATNTTRDMLIKSIHPVRKHDERS